MFWSGSPTAVTGCPPPNTPAINFACATSVSWYSSSSTAPNRCRYSIATCGCSSTTLSASEIWSPKSIAPRSRFSRRKIAAPRASSIRSSEARYARSERCSLQLLQPCLVERDDLFGRASVVRRLIVQQQDVVDHATLVSVFTCSNVIRSMTRAQSSVRCAGESTRWSGSMPASMP